MAARIPASKRREALIEAAFRVVARDGLSASSVRAISDEAGMAQSFFHYAFRDKGEMLKELIRITVEGFLKASRLGSITSSSPEAAIATWLNSMWVEVTAHPERSLALYELTVAALRDPELAGLAEWQYQTSLEQMAESLEDLEAVAGVEWKVPRASAARTALAMFDGLTLSWLADRQDSAAQDALDACAVMLAGLARGALATSAGGRTA